MDQKDEEPTFVSPTLPINSTLVANVRNKSLDFPVILKCRLSKEEVRAMALVNSGAGGNFIDATFTRLMKLEHTPIENPLKVYNVDGTRNKIGTISEKGSRNTESSRQEHAHRTPSHQIGLEESNLGIPLASGTKPGYRLEKRKTLMEKRMPRVKQKCSAHRQHLRNTIQ